MPVRLSLAEALYLWSWLHRSLTGADFDDLRERCQAAGRSLARGHRSHPRCPLLVDDRCVGHPARPLACRGWNSADAQACREAAAGARVPVPVDVRLRAVYANPGEALCRGILARSGYGPVTLVPILATLAREAAQGSISPGYPQVVTRLFT
jgi:hypothetical protein